MVWCATWVGTKGASRSDDVAVELVAGARLVSLSGVWLPDVGKKGYDKRGVCVVCLMNMTGVAVGMAALGGQRSFSGFRRNVLERVGACGVCSVIAYVAKMGFWAQNGARGPE